MLCGTVYRVHANDVAAACFDDLWQLCTAAGDKASLAIAMAGLVMDHAYQGRIREASRLASEAMALIESIGDPILTVGLSYPAIYAKFECGEWPHVLQWSQRVIDLADGDPFKGNFIFGSPLALALTSRAMARYYLGRPGWREDLRHGLDMARSADPLTYAAVGALGYCSGIPNGALVADDRAVREIEDALRIAQRSGNDMALAFARMSLGVTLVHRQTAAERDRGRTLLAEVSDVFRRHAHNQGIDRSSTCTRRGKGLGLEISTRRYRSCAPLSTICSARDKCWRGARQRRVFWWRHCSIAGPTATWPKPRLRLNG